MSHRARTAGSVESARQARSRVTSLRRRLHLSTTSRGKNFAPATSKTPPPKALQHTPYALPQCKGFESAEPLLRTTLISAMDVSGADSGFYLLCHESKALEVLLPRRLASAEALDLVLGRAAPAVRRALRERRIAAADAQGRALPLQDGFHEANAPSYLCLPLDLGRRQTGLLCLVRPQPARTLDELDLEIMQALVEQAALTINALYAGYALARLEASLCAAWPFEMALA